MCIIGGITIWTKAAGLRLDYFLYIWENGNSLK